jgi:hypothetical protein
MRIALALLALGLLAGSAAALDPPASPCQPNDMGGVHCGASLEGPGGISLAESGVTTASQACVPESFCPPFVTCLEARVFNVEAEPICLA